MHKPLKVGDSHYDSMAAATREARRILHASEPGTEIVGSDATFVLSLLAARAEKLEEIGDRPIVRVRREWETNYEGPSRTVCFVVDLADRTSIDFSFPKAISILADRAA